MKPHKDAKSTIVTEWLKKAVEDIDVSEHLLSTDALFPNAVAFHAQQAAEKFLKAYLTWHQVEFPKTHDIDTLLDLVETVDPERANSLRDTIVLTLYGVEVRYPGDRPVVSKEDARSAVGMAVKIRESVSKALPIL